MKKAARHVLGLFALLAFPCALLAGHGSLDPNVNQDNIEQTICVSGYTSLVRLPRADGYAIKLQFMSEAGIDPSLSPHYALDHIIPLALGGHPTDLDNLELQLLDIAKRKDRIEAKLQCLVCSNQVPLVDAQREIAEDWEAAYHKYGK